MNINILIILSGLMFSGQAQAELKYVTPTPETVSEKSETKCGVLEDAQAVLTQASDFMKANWNIGKIEDRAKLEEMVKKIAEFEEKLGYGRYCYQRIGDFKGSRVFNRALRDLNRFDRNLFRSNGPVHGGFDFPFPGGGIRFELNL